MVELDNVLKQFATGATRDEGQWRCGNPQPRAIPSEVYSTSRREYRYSYVRLLLLIVQEWALHVITVVAARSSTPTNTCTKETHHLLSEPPAISLLSRALPWRPPARSSGLPHIRSPPDILKDGGMN
ncbi:hypothetical protein PgNI_06245 [Pyricularia grisea]|uniref:Uncharacterized protein n=1 Tax=Pyricularia grisea TaxID=148305 RepID=A0A6P8B624_PYRGI|nr:hypothetical protein PgNI_06245 [Pyricularia grisea]TLD10796.1 hypothetical protein PgNI_06245 [Pyricularia grisea]